MGLVSAEYDSDSAASNDDLEPTTALPPAKRRKTNTAASPDEGAPAALPTLPPLPPQFHDLYSSTVRVSTVDDPGLHQGRRRRIPHVPGNWPSHLYIEWHPAPGQHRLLHSFVSALGGREEEELQAGNDGKGQAAPGAVTTLLVSDLGAPLPLHISLSRPVVLTTETKAAFHARLVAALQGCAVGPFELRFRPPRWHRTLPRNGGGGGGGGGRAFLVLPVDSVVAAAGDGPNPELTTLLDRCNDVVSSFGQPPLYADVHGDRRGAAEMDGRPVGVRDAFHVSIAWSHADVSAELMDRTAAVFARKEFAEGIAGLRLPVDSVKVKIGNVVTSTQLTEPSSKHVPGATRALFGI